MPSPVLDFWFEFASTYSYPAAMRVEKLAGAAGVAVRWRPFLLGPIFKAQGWDNSPFNLYPDKGRYMWHDLERLTASMGLPFRRPDPFPQSSLLAARVAWACADNTVQIHGGNGFATEYPASRLLADARILNIFEGAGEIQAQVIARRLMDGQN